MVTKTKTKTKFDRSFACPWWCCSRGLWSTSGSPLPSAVCLSRSTSRVIKQNLWVSLGVVAMLIPATILGLGIGTAVLFHEGSTLVVVINALRLLACRAPTTASAASAASAARVG